MSAVNPYLLFNGDCEAAFDLYRSVFGGEFAMKMRFSEMGGENAPPPEEANQIMHVALPFSNGSVLMGSDCPPSTGAATVGDNFSVSASADSKEDADKFFAGLSEGGTVKLPMQDMFWGSYFGMLTDKHGINWQVSYAQHAG